MARPKALIIPKIKECVQIITFTNLIRPALFLTLCTLTLVSTPVLAADCSQSTITLSSQADVDSFQANYGGGGTCDRVTQTLQINGDMTNLSGLSALTSVGSNLRISSTSALLNLNDLAGLNSIGQLLELNSNKLLADIGGLSNLTSLGFVLQVSGNDELTNLDGLSNLSSVGNFIDISFNPKLVSIEGLASITSLSGFLNIFVNNSLSNLDGFSSLSTLGGNLNVTNNNLLNNLDGLASLISVGGNVTVENNPLLGNCLGLVRLLDNVDDGLPGPGPGSAGIPDVFDAVTLSSNNQSSCNSVEGILLIFKNGFE